MHRKFETKNELLIGSIAGAIATIPKYYWNELMQLIGVTKFDNNWTAFSVVLNNYNHTKIEVYFAFLTAIIIGMFFGVILAFLFSKVFTSHLYLLKGAIYGAGIWLFNFGIASYAFFKYPTALREEVGIAVSMLTSLILYGVLSAYILKKFGIFKDEQI